MKHFTTPTKVQLDSIKLSEKIIKDNFIPDNIVVLWRGGASIGMYVEEALARIAVLIKKEIDHIAIRTSRYMNPTTTLKEVQVHNLGYFVERLNYNSKVLIIDDVFDSGLSIKAVLDNLQNKLRLNMPQDNNKTDLIPNYYVNTHSSDTWLVYPHELEGLSIKEIEDHMSPEIAAIIYNCEKVYK
jgi:hypoxanthine phosphoribosyltransferase